MAAHGHPKIDFLRPNLAPCWPHVSRQHETMLDGQHGLMLKANMGSCWCLESKSLCPGNILVRPGNSSVPGEQFCVPREHFCVPGEQFCVPGEHSVCPGSSFACRGSSSVCPGSSSVWPGGILCAQGTVLCAWGAVLCARGAFCVPGEHSTYTARTGAIARIINEVVKFMNLPERKTYNRCNLLFCNGLLYARN